MAGAYRMALVLPFLFFMFLIARASDLKLTTDFFVPLTGDYFTSHLLCNGMGLLPPFKYAIKHINSESFPALTGLGISIALLEYLPVGINTLHIHPRGTEVLTMVKGVLNVGLVDSGNKLYTKVLKQADVFVFPKGLVHYQINFGDEMVIAYAAFSSADSGTIALPGNLFASGIEDWVLKTAFKVGEEVVDQLQAALGV